MEAPYIYPFGWPFDDGLNYFTPERLTAYITALEVEGFDFHIHTIGNRGVREALDAIEAARTANGDVGARHQLTHIEWVNAADIPRFAELDVTANAQVTAWWTQPNTWQDNAYLIGSAVANATIPIGSIQDAGGRVTLSSDWDVSSYNPFRSPGNASPAHRKPCRAWPMPSTPRPSRRPTPPGATATRAASKSASERISSASTRTPASRPRRFPRPTWC